MFVQAWPVFLLFQKNKWKTGLTWKTLRYITMCFSIYRNDNKLKCTNFYEVILPTLSLKNADLKGLLTDFSVWCWFSCITCGLGLEASQWGGFRGDNGRVTQSILSRQRRPLVHLWLWRDITSCLHLSYTSAQTDAGFLGTLRSLLRLWEYLHLAGQFVDIAVMTHSQHVSWCSPDLYFPLVLASPPLSLNS